MGGKKGCEMNNYRPWFFYSPIPTGNKNFIDVDFDYKKGAI